jgi:hypothetical protein
LTRNVILDSFGGDQSCSSTSIGGRIPCQGDDGCRSQKINSNPTHEHRERAPLGSSSRPFVGTRLNFASGAQEEENLSLTADGFPFSPIARGGDPARLGNLHAALRG